MTTSHRMGAKLFHAGGRTDMTKLIVAFRNFSNVPKNLIFKFLMPIYMATSRMTRIFKSKVI